MRQIRSIIPGTIRQYLKPLGWLYDQYKRTYLPIHIYSGYSQAGNIPLTIAYAGTSSRNENIWIKEVLAPDSKIYYGGRQPYWKICNFLQTKHPDCSMLLLEPNIFSKRYFSNKPVFKIPTWLEMQIDISQPIDVMARQKTGEFKDIQRRIRKHDLHFEITHSQEEFDNFYFNMYVPYAQKRYDATAVVEDYASFRKNCLLSELYLVKQNEEKIAGTIIEYKKGKALARKLGAKNGKLEYVRMGSFGALYYFTITTSHEKGYNELHIGGSRPLLSNGVTRHKTRLLAEIIPHKNIPLNYTYMILLNNTPGIREFLIGNPFVHHLKKRETSRAIWIYPEQFASESEFRKHIEHYRCKGVNGTQIFTLGGNTFPEEWEKPEFTVRPAIEVFYSSQGDVALEK